jgi:predicted ATP-grasp superfamily ATP-dependent carboligase
VNVVSTLRGKTRRGEPWVLVSDGADAGTRDCVVAIRALADSGYRVAVTTRSRHPLLSRYVSRRVGVGEGEIAEVIGNEMDRGDYAAFIPAAESVVLSLEPQVPALHDKALVSRRAREVGLRVPEEVVFAGPADLSAAAATMRFPVVVKPSIRTFKAFRADHPSQLTRMPEGSGDVIVQPFLEGEMSAVAGVMWDSEIHSCSFERWERIWPIDCGLASWAVTTTPSERVVEALSSLMAGYSGLFVAQFVDGHLIDLNLRVHSSLPLAVKAGANLVAIYSELARGLTPPPTQAEPGHTFRWISGDLKGVITKLRSGGTPTTEAIKALAPVRGTTHSMFSWRDPSPMLARLTSHIGGRG